LIETKLAYIQFNKTIMKMKTVIKIQGRIMKRTISIALAFALVMAFSTFSHVYACGEKGVEGKASNSSAKVSTANSSCGHKAAKATTTDATSEKTQVITADSKVDVGSSCHAKDAAAKVEKTNSDCAAKCGNAKTIDASQKAESAPLESDDEVSSVPSTTSEEVLTN
jgi:hypothetical protein